MKFQKYSCLNETGKMITSVGMVTELGEISQDSTLDEER